MRWTITAALLIPIQAIGATAFGQVTARQASPTTTARQEIASPMELLVELPLNLPALVAAPAYSREINSTLVLGETWRSNATDGFVVDKARVTDVAISRGHDYRKRHRVVFGLALTTEWFRQDVDVVMRLLVDGKSVFYEAWHGTTIGNHDSGVLWFGGRGKILKADWRVPIEEFEALFEGASSVALKVTVTIDD